MKHRQTLARRVRAYQLKNRHLSFLGAARQLLKRSKSLDARDRAMLTDLFTDHPPNVHPIYRGALTALDARRQGTSV